MFVYHDEFVRLQPGGNDLKASEANCDAGPEYRGHRDSHSDHLEREEDMLGSC